MTRWRMRCLRNSAWCARARPRRCSTSRRPRRGASTPPATRSASSPSRAVPACSSPMRRMRSACRCRPCRRRRRSALRALLPFAAPRNPVDCTAQAFNDMSLIGRFGEAMVAEGGYRSVLAFFSQTGGARSHRAGAAAAASRGEGALSGPALRALRARADRAGGGIRGGRLRGVRGPVARGRRAARDGTVRRRIRVRERRRAAGHSADRAAGRARRTRRRRSVCSGWPGSPRRPSACAPMRTRRWRRRKSLAGRSC